MGTNYYWHDSPCEHCGRHETMHVGKSSMGWSFAFQSFPHALMNEDYPDWGYHPESPFGFSVESRADWRQILTTRPGRLVDEYDRQIDDPVAWLNSLVPPSVEQQKKENVRVDGVEYQRDAEGFRVIEGDFT